MSSTSALNPSARTYTPASSNGDTTGAIGRSPIQATPNWFPQLHNLQDELVLLIFSFVSDVPYESSSTGKLFFTLHGSPKFHSYLQHLTNLCLISLHPNESYIAPYIQSNKTSWCLSCANKCKHVSIYAQTHNYLLLP